MENGRLGLISSISPFKIISLIGSIIMILASFVGAVTWISINMANSSTSIEVIQVRLDKQEKLIEKNSQIIGQHARLLMILEGHEDTLQILTDFMTQGGRFTEADGSKLHDELQGVKDRLQHYEVLESELSWIKKSIAGLERDIRERFDQLSEEIKESRQPPINYRQ